MRHFTKKCTYFSTGLRVNRKELGSHQASDPQAGTEGDKDKGRAKGVEKV